ncbi:MAG: DUF2946 family protein [Pseudomonadota bacterium]
MTPASRRKHRHVYTARIALAAMLVRCLLLAVLAPLSSSPAAATHGPADQTGSSVELVHVYCPIHGTMTRTTTNPVHTADHAVDHGDRHGSTHDHRDLCPCCSVAPFALVPTVNTASWLHLRVPTYLATAVTERRRPIFRLQTKRHPRGPPSRSA